MNKCAPLSASTLLAFSLLLAGPVRADDKAALTPETRAAVERQSQQQLGDDQAKWGQALATAVLSHWQWPAGGQYLHCAVHIELAPDGKVQNTRISSPSGNAAFDEAAMKAVHAASPLPLPANKAAFAPEFDMQFVPPPASGH